MFSPVTFTKLLIIRIYTKKKYNNSFHEKNDKNKVEKKTRHRIEIKLILKVS